MAIEGRSTNEIVRVLTAPPEDVDIVECDLEQSIMQAQKTLGRAKARVIKLKEKIQFKMEL